MIAALRACLCSLGLYLLAGATPALQAAPVVSNAEQLAPKALIGLIIDDLGNSFDEGREAIKLPGAVTYSILPQTTYSVPLAELAHLSGKEVMLHQPMEAMNGKAMGPGGLSMDMSREQLRETLQANLASVPHARGLNNHMGSLLTRHAEQMKWLMLELRSHDNLFFVDSTTTRFTVARRTAWENEVPNLRRNIFLDHVRDPRSILSQFVRLVEQAKSVDLSLAIAHPYPETLGVLKQVLPRLSEYGVELVSVSELIRRTVKRREELWQASLSPLPKGAKN